MLFRSSGFVSGISDGEMRIVETLRQSVINNFRSVLLLYLCGMSFYLFPLIYLHMAAKGFVIGFNVGFMTLFFGGKGFLFVIVSVLPQSVILIPTVMAMSVVSHNFATRKKKNGRKVFGIEDKSRETLKYTYVYLLFCFFNALSALIDTFVIPVFVKSISGLF